MWAMEDGDPVIKELNDEYYEAYKEKREVVFYTGFRIWKNQSKSAYTASADGGGVIYTLTDWSSEITYPEKEEYDWSGETTYAEKEEDKVDLPRTEKKTKTKIYIPSEGT